MYNIFHFIHLLGAIAMGFYAIVPFIVRQLDKVPSTGREGLLVGIDTANRIAQYSLLAEFITGGYLMSQAKYSVLWMTLTTIIVLAIAACGGMMGKQIKLARQSGHHGQAYTMATGKISLFSFLIFFFFLTMVVLMVNRYSL